MNRRKVIGSAAALAVVAVVAIGVLPSFKKKRATTLPYWQRSGFLSSFLRESASGPTGLESLHVPEGFRVELATQAEMVFYPAFASFDDRGRLFVCESAGKNISDEEALQHPEFRIRMLEDTKGDGVFDRGTVFADKITMAMGAQWYHGSLYVAAPPDLLRFQDTNGDGVADRREVVLTGWSINANGTTLHGPFLGPDGWMYLTFNTGPYKINTKEGTTLTGPGGRVFRAHPDGAGLEWIVGGGFDNAIEMVFTPAGEMIGTMTYYSDPKAGLRDSLLHYVEGGVYPKWRPMVEKYKRTGELMPAITKFARIAPSGLALYRGASFGPEYEGNLFSAQFNPHRVQRHIVSRDGATFGTKDEDFLTSTDPDFHPTDVVEDADGSLLVLDTGGWYLRSCPVSRIAKPQVKGAVYRVRKIGAAPVQDPWGKDLQLQARAPSELAKLLDDPRPAVRDRVQDMMIQAGEPAIEPFIQVRQSAASPAVRCAATFGLARIGTPKAEEAVRAALSDPNFLVRIAAARAVGLAKDREAVTRLMEMVRRDEPPVRRQAATGLGQIGDTRAVAALLAAAADPEDRFVEHSIIYALIQLRTSEPVIAALKDPRSKVRKAALIALDQMDDGLLPRDKLAPLLNDGDQELRTSVLWVVSRHSGWSSEVLRFLHDRLRARESEFSEMEGVREALLAFCEDRDIQSMTGELLGDRAVTTARKLFLLDTIDRCRLKTFPSIWTDQFHEQLRGGDPALRARVVTLIRSRQIAGFDSELQRIASSQSEPDALRTSALGALVSRQPEMAESSFQFLLRLLGPGTGITLRLSAAQVIGRAKLSESQLVLLARDQISQADPLILPNLLDAFKITRSNQAGKELVEALLRSPNAADDAVGERIPQLLKNFPGEVRASAKPLLDRLQKEKDSRAERLKALEPLLTGGDPGGGRKVFFGQKAGCSSCHTIGSEGGDVGPDLTAVGAIRSGIDLLEAVVYPSASFVPGHEVYHVTTATEVYTGVLGENSGDAVVVVSGPNDRVRVSKKEIVSMLPSSVSLMPDGFADNLTHTEMADLLAFLQAQKSGSQQAEAGQ
jgi:putative membrane-bound dehydrogenase-like protein